MKKFKEIKECRLCKTTLKEAIKLLKMPVGDIFKDTKKEALKIEKYPIEFLICPKCHNIQLSLEPCLDDLYKDYIYLSSTSVDLKNYYEVLSGELLKELKKEHAFIIEFGSNEGLLLEFMRNALKSKVYRWGGARLGRY